MKISLALVLLTTALAACSEPTPVGRWVGQTSQTYRGIESNRVEIHITQVGENGALEGTIFFGEPGALPPPTDPDLGYALDTSGLTFDLEPPMFVEHFPYSLSGFYAQDDSVLVGGRNRNEVWTDWCEMQTSYSSGDSYGCLPNCGSRSDDEGEQCFLLCGAVPDEPVDCGQLALCHGIRSACYCDASGCSAGGGTDTTFELVFDGDSLQGTFFDLGTGSLVRQ